MGMSTTVVIVALTSLLALYASAATTKVGVELGASVMDKSTPGSRSEIARNSLAEPDCGQTPSMKMGREECAKPLPFWIETYDIVSSALGDVKKMDPKKMIKPGTIFVCGPFEQIIDRKRYNICVKSDNKEPIPAITIQVALIGLQNRGCKRCAHLPGFVRIDYEYTGLIDPSVGY